MAKTSPIRIFSVLARFKLVQ